MKTSFAELEMALFPGPDGSAGLEFTFALPGSDTKTRLLGAQAVTAHFDLEGLAALQETPADYGARLAGMLFAAPRAAIAFARAREAARGRDLPLRLRLCIASGDDPLHGLAWETLADPEDDLPLAAKEDVYFSRLLASTDSRPVYLTPRQDLRGLVMVASPTNLDRLGLPALDVAAEAGRAARELVGVRLAVLNETGSGAATLNRLVDALRVGSADGSGFDILYLVSHGGHIRGKYLLVLEDEQRQYKNEDGEAVVQALKGLARPPRLVVLLACQGARVRPASADRGFAAHLVEAGIPAVLAMQGDFTTTTSALFMPAFFRELARDGQIDRAMAVARGAVRDRPDFWMPALFTLLESGMIWKDTPPPAGGPKYQVTVRDAKGTVIGDNNTITQNF